jgi:GntR family transcriptional regulator, transcriptional repressor for pyruvate dehydrogenase complex
MARLIPVVRKTLAEQIGAQLFTMINEGVWKVGERLPSEPELCKALHVGRSSLREAIRSLVFTGIVEIRPGEGTFVSEGPSRFLRRIVAPGSLNNARDMADLFEARVILEPELAALCAQRAGKDELDDLERQVGEMEQILPEADLFAEHDLHFHISIAAASQNHALRGYLKAIAEPLGELIRKGARTGSSRQLAHGHHVKILDALKQRNASKARASMRAHLRTFQRGYHLFLQELSDEKSKPLPAASLLSSSEA